MEKEKCIEQSSVNISNKCWEDISEAEETTCYWYKKGGKMRLRWLKTVSSTYICMGRYNHSLTLDATIMVSKNCPIIGEDVGIFFVTRYVTIATV